MAEKPTCEPLEQRIAISENESARRNRFETINRAMFKISNAVNTASNLDELFQEIHLALSSIIDTTNFYIALYDEAKDTLTFPYFVDSADEINPPVIEISKTESITAEVIRTGRPLMVTKAERLAQRAKTSLAIHTYTPSEIWLGVPLKTRSQIIGVMTVQSYHDPNCFDQTDMDVMVSVADQVATAIERKQAEEELKQHRDHLAQMVRERTIELQTTNDLLSQEIVERKRTEKELLVSWQRFQDMVEQIYDWVWEVDTEGQYTYASIRVKDMLGYEPEEVLGKTPFNLMPAEEAQRIAPLFQSLISEQRPIIALENINLHKDGRQVYLETSGCPFYDNYGNLKGYRGSDRDITDRKQAEEEKAKLESQLQLAQKFEAIATLAGGVAHDFNNLLMGIQGRASLISMDLDVSHPHREHIQAIEEYIRSATSLTRQLLGFARGGKYEVNPVDMNELLLDSSAMFGRTKKEIQIHTKCQASPLVVEADKGQIEQVLLNMYINAWQAMPPDGSELYLETKISTLDEAYCKPHQAEPGRYVRVSITDTGSGMDEATRQRVFDPFFTTKGKKRGTGMGLASAYGIIKNHGGLITVYSEIGRGTTFNIYLPLSDKEANREISMEGRLVKGSATILLVDDEEFIIDVGQAMLARLGYRVMVCRGGQEAVNVITDIGNTIDLVILDMIMPGMDGSTAFNRIREIQPDMPVLLSSGYAMNGHAEKIMRSGCNGFIQKPYNISELSQKIRKVLDESKVSIQQ
jgi:two-component system cell cycle sensor histidine kinase/response regulator CckA